MTSLRTKLTDAADLGQRLAELDREDLEALLFSAVSRLAYLHCQSTCTELEQLQDRRRAFEREMGRFGGGA